MQHNPLTVDQGSLHLEIIMLAVVMYKHIRAERYLSITIDTLLFTIFHATSYLHGH